MNERLYKYRAAALPISAAPQKPTELPRPRLPTEPVGRSAPRAGRRAAKVQISVTVCKFCGYRVHFAVTVCILRLLTVCILQLPCVCIRTNKQAPFLDVYVCTFRSVADVLYVDVL